MAPGAEKRWVPLLRSPWDGQVVLGMGLDRFGHRPCQSQQKRILSVLRGSGA